MKATHFCAATFAICVILLNASQASAESFETELICKSCEQNLEIEQYDPGEELPYPEAIQPDWFDLGELEGEPGLTCEGTQVLASHRGAADRYEVSNLTWCYFDPTPMQASLGLNFHIDECGALPEEQIEIFLNTNGGNGDVRLEGDLTISIPIHPQHQPIVYLGNLDEVDWEFTCAPPYNSKHRFTVAQGTSAGLNSSTAFYEIPVPRFPRNCHDRRFTVKSSQYYNPARVFNLNVRRESCIDL